MFYKMIIEERWGRFMAGRYCVKYKESQNTLQKICKLFRMDESDITLKFGSIFPWNPDFLFCYEIWKSWQ